MNQDQLTLIIKAQNDASRELSNLQNDVSRLADGMKKSITSATSSFGDNFRAFAGNAASAFGGVANSIENLARKAVGLLIGSGLSGAYFVNLASDLELAQNRMGALAGDTGIAQKAFGELYNYTLGKPIAFPTAAKAAQTLMGYGVESSKVVDSMKALSRFSIVNGADMGQLALAYGQVNAKGKLMGQEILQLTNNFVPVKKVLTEFYGSAEKAQQMMDDSAVSAEDFNKAMANFIPDSAIAAQANTFRNRMITLQGTLRSTGLALLGVKVDPVKGYLIEAGGLFERLSTAVSDASKWLSDNKQTIIDVGNVILNNAVPAAGALLGAWAAMKAIQAAFTFASMISGLMSVVTAIKGGTGAMVAFNAAAAANPIGLIAIAIAAVVAALVFLQIKFDIFGKTLEFFKPAIDVVKNAFNDFLTVIKPVYEFIGTQLADAFRSLQDIGKQMAESFQPIIEAFQKLMENKILQDVLKAIGLALLAIVAAPVVIFFAALIAIVTAVSAVLKFVAEHFDTIKNVIMIALTVAFLPLIIVFKTVVGSVQLIISILQSLWTTATVVFNALVAVITPIVQAVITVFTTLLLPAINLVMGVLGSLGSIAWSIFSGIAQVVGTVVSTIVQIIGVVLFGIVKFIWDNILSPIATVFATVWNGIVATVSGAVNRGLAIIRSVFSAIYGVVSSVFGSVWNVVSSIASRIWNTVSSKFNEIKNTISNAMSGAMNAISNLVGNAANAGANLIAGLARGIANGKDAVVNKIKSICEGALDTVKKFFGIKSPSRVMMGMGKFMMQGLNSGIEGMKKTVVSTAQGVSTAVAGGFEGGLNAPNVTGTISGSAAASSRLSGSRGNNVNQTNQTTNQFLAPVNLNTKEAADAWYDRIDAKQGRDQQLARMGVAL